MNEPLQPRPLELATSPEALPAGGDAQITNLREGWEVFSQALAEQDRHFDADRFSRHVAAALSQEQVQCAARRRLAAWLAAGAAIAASLLLVAAWRGGQRDHEPVVAALPDAADVWAEGTTRWDDPLEEHIARMQWAVQEPAAAPRFESALWEVDRKLAELASDLEGSSL
jgi:hypothetical protein